MLLLGLSSATLAQSKDQTPTIRSTRKVAVGGFDPRTAIENYQSYGLGASAASVMTTELSNCGALMLERAHLQVLEREGALGPMGIVDGSTAMPLGQKIGAEWMVIGSFTHFGVREKRFGGGVLDRLIPNGWKVKNVEAEVKVEVRLVDIRTGVILGAVSGEGKENKGSFDAQVFKPWEFLASIRFEDTEWTESMIGKATYKAIRDAAWKLASKWDDAERKCKSLGDSVTPSPKTETAPLGNGAQRSALKGLSFVVVIDESILHAPRVPDPAAQTEMIRQLLLSGVKVVDDERTRQLVSDRAVLAMLRGQVDEAKLMELRTMTGADVLIVGEAIAQRNDPEAQMPPFVLSRARVEIRAILLDTGQILAADAEQGPGRDLSEILAGKDALQKTAALLAPRFIDLMATQAVAHNVAPGSAVLPIQLEIAGWESITAPTQFIAELRSINGIKSVKQDSFRGGVLFLTAECSNWKAEDLAATLETAEKLLKFKIRVRTATNSKIEASTNGT